MIELRGMSEELKDELVLPWTDPLYEMQWYLHGGAKGGYDMKVEEAWKLGYSGKGVVAAIVDDGVEKSHPDLAANYVYYSFF